MGAPKNLEKDLIYGQQKFNRNNSQNNNTNAQHQQASFEKSFQSSVLTSSERIPKCFFFTTPENDDKKQTVEIEINDAKIEFTALQPQSTVVEEPSADVKPNQGKKRKGTSFLKKLGRLFVHKSKKKDVPAAN